MFLHLKDTDDRAIYLNPTAITAITFEPFFDAARVDLIDASSRSFPLDSDAAAALRRWVDAPDDLLAVAEPLAEWLGFFRDRGEQVGNLDMTLVDRLRTAIARVKGEAL